MNTETNETTDPDRWYTTPAKVKAWRALAEAGDYAAIIDATSGLTNHCTVAYLWSAAMQAEFGPVNLHKSYCDAQDRPLAETLARYPEIAACVEKGRADVLRYVASLERQFP